MYVGIWDPNRSYRKGDIVYIQETLTYYTCALAHDSNNLTYPSKEDIYWVHIDSKFLSDISVIKPRPFTTENIPDFGNFLMNQPVTSEPPNTPSTPVLANLPLPSPLQRKTSSPQPIRLASEQDLVQKQKRENLKRKLRQAENSVDNYKRQRTNSEITDLRDKLLLLNVDVGTKSFLLDKYDLTRKASGSDYSKGMAWLKTAAGLPYGRYKQLKVKASDPPERIKAFFQDVKSKLDKNIHGLEHVKQEILEYVARKITNPHGKGHILALCGPPGVGKSKIIKSLAGALELPFFQINCGGLNDVSVLTGHSETYIGSKPGKIVEILQNANYMNPIIYMDEVDKISENKSVEINGVLTHLLDEEQNNKFQDNYLSSVNLNLSKVFFVLSFNDITKVDEIVSDRLKIIYIQEPTLEQKVQICHDKVIPELLASVNFDSNCVIRIDKEVIEYIATQKCDKESGVRKLRQALEKVFNKLNYDILTGTTDNLYTQKTQEQESDTTKERESSKAKTIYNITRRYIDATLETTNQNQSYLSMYI
ncbi:MAG: AAA family ATPase [Proteobacteria bacterium]|nr:AAA family ATPase [Pseudomonadota bacterium]NBP13586.1 AAA family ATPase [bacterium]